ncbi:MAG TPA: hypothetical protein VG028_05495 [Terriglobia bacterium]|nr:hypothetical protein [Terriglobia bacterium]
MRIITRNELTDRSRGALDALLSKVLNAIALAEEGSPEWMDAMESLANIRQEQAARNVTLPRPSLMRYESSTFVSS